MAVSDDFADLIIEHQVDLLRFDAGLRSQVLGHLKELERELTGKIANADLAGISRQSFRFRRMESLLSQTRKTIGTAYRTIDKSVGRELMELAELESRETLRIAKKVFQADIMTTAVTRGRLRQLVGGSLIQGSPARDWWAKQSTSTRDRFASQLRLGVSGGETNDQLVRRIRGAATGQRKVVEIKGKRVSVPEYSGGVMSVSTREAEALVRSSVQTVANNTQMATYLENRDIISGVQALATLDMRTTDLCKSRDGLAWEMDDDLAAIAVREKK